MPEVQIDQQRLEALGPAEVIIRALTTFTDHLFHGRPGVIKADGRTNIGVRWQQATWVDEGEERKVYLVAKTQTPGKKGKMVTRTTKTLIGTVPQAGKGIPNGTKIGDYEWREPGIFPEVAVYLYKQAASVWEMDKELSARWASRAFVQEHKDLKVILSALMLVQTKCGQPVMEGGEVLFYDDDYRDVGEAMFLIKGAGHASMEPKHIALVGQVLKLPGVMEINRDLGFARSARNASIKRYEKAVHLWLAYREANPQMLKGLVKGAYRRTVIDLARHTGYKPTTTAFYDILRYKQKQAATGHRTLHIGVEVSEAQSWKGLSEQQVCERIVAEKPRMKLLVGLLPPEVGMTRAVMAAAIEAGALSNADLIIYTPTIEELGLLKVPAIKARWDEAMRKAEDQRAANIAKNVKTKEAREGLQEAADVATAKAMDEATKDLHLFACVDKSSSMQGALERGKACVTKFLGGIPMERLHVSVFNTQGSKLDIKAPKAAAVEHAFQGHAAGGGTVYSSGVSALAFDRPKDGMDSLFLFVGDEAGEAGATLAMTIRQGQFNCSALALLPVVAPGWQRGRTVRDAALALGVPYFEVEESLFDDPYNVTRILRNLIASTPVGEMPAGRTAPVRKTLAQEILETPLLQKPTWAVAA